MWRRDGKELFFLTPNKKLMAVDLDTIGRQLPSRDPEGAFSDAVIPIWYWRNIYVPSADGQRFLMLTPAIEAKAAPITVVVNWTTMLKK